MRDRGKIIIGLIVFLILMTFPIWYNALQGVTAMEDPEIATRDVPGKDKCVRSAEYMRPFHMDLLNEWRDKVVREGERYTEGPYGGQIEMSLSNSCLDCHSNKENFCDRCHNTLAVNPYCWDCHLTKAEVSGGDLAMTSEPEEEN
jgi:hypothetical protein